MPKKKTTKKKTTTTTTKTEKPGLRPRSPVGRALLAMVRLFLDDDGFGDERLQARKEVFVHGFLERSRSQYGVEYESLEGLERDIVNVLLSEEAEVDLAKRQEAAGLAAALIDKVFDLKQQRLKELVPQAVAAVQREAAAAEKERAARARPKAKPTASSKAKGGPAKPAARGKAKGGPAGSKKAPKRTTAAERRAALSANGTINPRGSEALRKGKAASSKARPAPGSTPKRSSLASPVEPARRGADDPAYGQALLHLRSLGSHVDEAYAVDDLEHELGIPLYRGEAILEAAKARGDWPTINGKASAEKASPEKALDQPAEDPPEPEKGRGGPSSDGKGNAQLDAAQRWADEQKRLGRKATANGLKKALGIGHARAASLLEQVGAT